MHRLSKETLGASLPLYALGAIFFVPLSIGVLLVSTDANLNEHANQISRDIASMYAQGVDFGQASNQSIAINVAENMGMQIRDGKGVLILSKVRLVHNGDCTGASARQCANEGRPVITQRYVIGNETLLQSSLGTPRYVDPQSGDVANWPSDVSARARDFSTTLKAGESSYVAECYMVTPEQRSGVYSRAMF